MHLENRPASKHQHNTQQALQVLPASPVRTGEAGDTGVNRGLEIDNVSVRLSKRVILDAISLDIRAGEFIIVLGNSGSGKTTLLRAIAGFIPIERGTLRLGGQDLTRLPTYRRNIGFVHQQYALFPHMTVAENVAFGLRERHVPQVERTRRVETYLRLVHLDSFANAYPAQLSGGMQQRVALARSLVIEPQLLLLDEPLSALDANLRVELRRELLSLHQRFPQLPIVYVTHDREEALQLADRIVLMRAGRIEQVSKPRQMYDEPANVFVARYLGVVNILPQAFVTELARRDKRMASMISSVATMPEGQWMVRPERVFINRQEERDMIALSGIVREVEWMGSTQTLHIEISDAEQWEMTALATDRGEQVMVGSSVRVAFSLEDCTYVRE